MKNSRLFIGVAAISMIAATSSFGLDITGTNDSDASNSAIINLTGGSVGFLPLNIQNINAANLKTGTAGSGVNVDIVGIQSYSTNIANTQSNLVDIDHGSGTGNALFDQRARGNVVTLTNIDDNNPSNRVRFVDTAAVPVTQNFGDALAPVTVSNSFGVADADTEVFDIEDSIAVTQSTRGNDLTVESNKVRGDFVQNYVGGAISNDIDLGTTGNLTAGGLGDLTSIVIGNNADITSSGAKLKGVYDQNYSVTTSANTVNLGGGTGTFDVDGGSTNVIQTQTANRLVTDAAGSNLSVSQSATGATSNSLIVNNFSHQGSFGFTQTITGNTHSFTIK